MEDKALITILLYLSDIIFKAIIQYFLKKKTSTCPRQMVCALGLVLLLLK